MVKPPKSSQSIRQSARHPVTPDGRYFVVRGRLWRCSDPHLSMEERKNITGVLMKARRDKGKAIRDGNVEKVQQAKQQVDAAKIALGERGATWWVDDAPDWNRHMARNTPYAQWFACLTTESTCKLPSPAPK
jgi:hypothetical protein